jgi:hypothetical protein
MYDQFDLEVRCKTPQKREDHLIIINFVVKKFTVKNTPQKKALMFECYNLLGSMDCRAKKF